ncbi:hypothetical protein IQ255_11075 [Pleurocapsales cyanobacterium LEGE 10410]|nr:hypothetical protein [Pleurocapsales cyanobacterium LEGE 10410]
MVIEYLIGISGATLIVYRVGEYFQYEIVFWDGSLYQPQEIYHESGEARDVGLESIKIVIGYQ